MLTDEPINAYFGRLQQREDNRIVSEAKSINDGYYFFSTFLLQKLKTSG